MRHLKKKVSTPTNCSLQGFQPLIWFKTLELPPIYFSLFVTQLVCLVLWRQWRYFVLGQVVHVCTTKKLKNVSQVARRFDNFLVPMQCTGNSGSFLRGKWAAIVRHYPAFDKYCCPVCNVFVFPYHRLWGLLLRQMDMGSLTCAQVWVGAVHTKGCRAQTSLYKNRLGRVNRNNCYLVTYPAPPGDWTQGLRIWIPTLKALSYAPIPGEGLCTEEQLVTQALGRFVSLLNV